LTAQLIDGKAIAQKVRNEVAVQVSKRNAAGNPKPTLATVLVGDRPDSRFPGIIIFFGIFVIIINFFVKIIFRWIIFVIHIHFSFVYIVMPKNFNENSFQTSP